MQAQLLAKYLIVLMALFSFNIFAQGPMVSPRIDEKSGEPFSYFSKPTDELGMMDAKVATEVTPEGYLYTGFGELMFFAGIEQIPIQQRIRTLEEGFLPIIHYTYRQEGIVYHFTMFAATLNDVPESNLINFIRVNIRNENVNSTRIVFSTGIRYEKEMNTGTGVSDNRFLRPYKGNKLGDYYQLGESFNPNWKYRFNNNTFMRNGKVMYLFPDHPQGLSFTLKDDHNSKSDITPRKLGILPTTPVGIAYFSRILKPKEEFNLIFKMPVIPLDSQADLIALKKADFYYYKKKIIAYWKRILNQGMQIILPEKKVVDTFKANLIYDLIARDKIGDYYIQTVNKLHYHQFFLRDAADIVHMYDITGYSLFAKQVLSFFSKWQQPNGNFISQEQEYDAWGQVLWTYGQHYRLTGDLAFAKSLFPAIKKAVNWLKTTRKHDPLHIMIASNVADNEHIPGHITGYNFLALSGLKNAISLADALGYKKDAAVFRKEYQDYYNAFLKVLSKATDKTGGYIPPALDKKGGQDWGNLLGSYPESILDPWDDRITATLKATHEKYQEGIMTYGDGRWLHHYLTIKNILTELIRGEQKEVIKEFYSLLLHTSSTHAGFEYCIRPWGDRNFQSNLAPHGWFAAEYRTLLRNMMIREYGKELHLLSAISPAWVGKGKLIEVSHAPTEFGNINFVIKQANDNFATFRIKTEWRNEPNAIILHLPWFMHINKILADGKPVQSVNGSVRLSPKTRAVDMDWQRQSMATEVDFNKAMLDLSYQKTVDAYKAEYRKRYDAMLHGNENLDKLSA